MKKRKSSDWAGGLGMPADIEMNIGVRLLARLLNITDARVNQLAREGIIPRTPKMSGQFPLAPAVRGYVIYLQGAKGARESVKNKVVDPDLLEPFKRKAHYQAERDRLKLAEENGQLIPRDEVELEQGRVATIVTQVLESLPDVMERDCGATPMMVERMEQLISDARGKIYDGLTTKEKDAQQRSVRKRA